METKQYLGQIKRLDRMIQNKLSEIYQLKTMACSITIEPKEDKIQTSSDKDRMGSTVVKIVDLENEVDSLVDELVDKRKKIIEQIDNMDNDDYYHVLTERYVLKKTFNEIAQGESWGSRQVYRVHDKAIVEFERIYGEEYLKL